MNSPANRTPSSRATRRAPTRRTRCAASSNSSFARAGGALPPHRRRAIQPSVILHLITGLETGGAEGTLDRLVAGLDPTRFAPVVVSMTGAGTVGPRIRAAGIPLATLGMRRGAADPRGLLRLRRLLRRHRPAILQTWLYHADLLGLVARRLGWVRHLVWNIRCTEAVEAGLVRALLRHSSRLPSAVVVNSQAGRRFHEARGYRPGRWEYVPNGIDTETFRPDPAARLRLRAELGIDARTTVIGLAARWHPMKDHASFFAAAARLATRRPPLLLLLAGTGIEGANRELMQTIARAGPLPAFRLLGEYRDMPAFYPACDIATLTSAFGEGFPNVLGEAMACGVPCVATDSGDADEILGPFGDIVPPRDPPALAAAWERLAAAGAGDRIELGMAARRRIARCYGLTQMVRRYEALYGELLQNPSPPRGTNGARLAQIPASPTAGEEQR